MATSVPHRSGGVSKRDSTCFCKTIMLCLSQFHRPDKAFDRATESAVRTKRIGVFFASTREAAPPRARIQLYSSRCADDVCCIMDLDYWLWNFSHAQ
ncbi:hypothetical protein B0H10DRAFT_1994271 [Mycena sp. CBHHK59/15]|nr:hypothetical protein B0H10DRAFT_1994271 [Mycena sp. CBHHK59/15]